MLLERSTLALVVACALHLAACSDETAPSSSLVPSGGSGSAPPASGGATAGSGSGGVPVAGGGMGGTAGTAGGAGAGSAPAMACSSYMDESSWSLLVQISNQRKEVLYVGQKDATCETARPFEVRDGSRALLPALEKCPSSCQQLMQAGPVACPLACPAPSTIALQPGETLKLPWDGRFAVPQTLPASCASAAAQGTSACVQAAHIEASVFTFSAQAGTARSCLSGSACTCTPNANGGCTAAGSVIGGTIITTEYLVNLDPGDVSTAGEPPYIGLVFRD